MEAQHNFARLPCHKVSKSVPDNTTAGDEREKGGLTWSARGGNKHVWPLPGRQPIHQVDLKSKVSAIQVILCLAPLVS